MREDPELDNCKYHLSLILEARGILDTDKIERLTERVRDVLEDDDNINDIMELMCGASLAHHGLLDSVSTLLLCDRDLSQVPAQHLVSLASCVTHIFQLDNVSGCDLVSLLTRLKCEVLMIMSQNLGREETQALVQTMESVLEEVFLGDDVTLDVEALAEYSGQGVCREVKLYYTLDRYREELMTWARSKNWRVVSDEFWHCIVKQI